jgi:ParB family transcriptional regulator, chromosome partitioning protein
VPEYRHGGPSNARHSKSNPQADALLLATIKAVGIVQPPVVTPEGDGGNGYVIDAGHRKIGPGFAVLLSRS